MTTEGRNAELMARLARQLAMGGCCGRFPNIQPSGIDNASRVKEFVSDYMQQIFGPNAEFSIKRAPRHDIGIATEAGQPAGFRWVTPVTIGSDSGEVTIYVCVPADSQGLCIGTPSLQEDHGPFAHGIPSEYHLAHLANRNELLTNAMAAQPSLKPYASTFGDR